MEKVVTRQDIAKAFNDLGVKSGDSVLIHTSLRSFGPLENGAQTVIDGIEDCIGKEGTLLVPTLCQKDFENSFKTWHLDKPSDVGYLTEYFRKLPGVLRSDHPTHSVAARGRLAYEYTHEHSAYGPRLSPFGEYSFGDSSPWNKMWQNDVHIVFIGVDMTSNTMKHLVESRFLETVLSRIKNAAKREELEKRLLRFGEEGVWCFYSGPDMDAEVDKAGLITHTECGLSHLKRVSAKESSEYSLKLLLEDPQRWCVREMRVWIDEALEYC